MDKNFFQSEQFESIVADFYQWMSADGYCAEDFTNENFAYKSEWAKLGHYPYPTNPKEVIECELRESYADICDKSGYSKGCIAYRIGKRLFEMFS